MTVGTAGHNVAIQNLMWNLMQHSPAEKMSGTEIDIARKKTRSLSIIEGSAWSVMWGMGESFVAPFAIMLKAGNVAMGLLGTLPTILGALAQITGASLAERIKDRRLLVATAAMLQSLGYLLLLWIPFFFPSMAIPAVVCIATLLIIFVNLGAPAWNSMMGDIVPEDIRGRYFGKRTSVITLVMVLSTVLAGKILSTCESNNNLWLGFGMLFSAAMIFRAFSAIALGGYYDTPFNPPKAGYFSFWEFIRRTPRSNFVKFTFAVALMNGATTISAPFFSVYMLRDMHWTQDKFAVMQATMLLSQYVFLRWWGVVCDRNGNRSVIAATSILIPFLPILWASFTNYHFLLAIQVASGALWSGFNLATANFMFDSVTPEKRHRAFSYFNVINGTFVFVGGSLVGTFLADNLPSAFKIGGMHIAFLSSLPVVFIVSGLVRIIVVVIFLPLFKEVRKIEPITSGEILWRMAIGEPIFDQMSHLLGLISAPFRNSENTGDKPI